MKKPVRFIFIVFFISFFIVRESKGQAFYLEAHIGHDLFEQKLISSKTVNNIAILPATENLGEPLYGIKAGSDIYNKISWQMKADLGWALYSFSVLDLVESCGFCPVEKVLTTGGRRFDFSISPRYQLIKFRNFETFGYAGFSFSKTQKSKRRNFSFNGNHIRTAEVMMLINESFGKSIFLYHMGLALEYKRFTLDLTVHRQMSSSTSRGIFFEGEFHQFVNRQNISILTIGYKLIKKKER